MSAITRTALSLLSGAWLALAGSAALAATVSFPQEIRAEYSLSRGSTRIGTVNESFTRDGESYRIRSETIAAGALRWVLRDRLVVSSEGRITAQGLQPQRYAFERDKAPAKNIHARFDWAQRKLTSEHDGRSETLVLQPGTQDRLSIMYQFMALDLSAKLPAAWMTNGKHVTRYEYSLAGSEEVESPAGRFATLRVVRADPEDGSRLEVWLAPSLKGLPVRVRLTRADGTRDEQQLIGLTLTP